MQQRQYAADQGVSQSCEPAGVVVRKLIHMYANDFDEHQFRKPVENALAAGPFIFGLGGGRVVEMIQQTMRTRRRVAAEPHETRQRVEQRIERTRVATEEAAY